MIYSLLAFCDDEGCGHKVPARLYASLSSLLASALVAKETNVPDSLFVDVIYKMSVRLMISDFQLCTRVLDNLSLLTRPPRIIAAVLMNLVNCVGMDCIEIRAPLNTLAHQIKVCAD